MQSLLNVKTTFDGTNTQITDIESDVDSSYPESEKNYVYQDSEKNKTGAKSQSLFSTF